jgi:hypothetical protein
MSKVVIQGNASGTGDFTIAAPNSDTNRTLTLPDEAGEVLVNGTTSNVGIGTSSAASFSGKLVVNNGTNKNINLRSGIRLAGSAIQSIQDDAATDSPLEFYTQAQLQLEGNPITFYNNGERMRIDASGRVTMPNQPMLSASRTTNFGSNSASQTLINYDTAQVNVGNHYNTTSGLFTCPVNGNYRVTAFGMNVGATSSGVFVYNAVSVRKNNSQIGATAYNYGDGYVHMSGNWIIPASAGDSISIFTASCLANYGQLTIELIS